MAEHLSHRKKALVLLKTQQNLVLFVKKIHKL